MGLTIDSVTTNPVTLNAGQTQIDVTAQIISDMAVNDVMAQAIDSTGMGFAPVRLEPLRGSMPPQYTFRGVMVIPPGTVDGTYPISVTAKDDGGTSVTNNTTKFIVARGTTPPPPPPQPEEKDKCCCKVSLNITAGPVNIYVCDRDCKIESNNPA
jgi:hypothetical protein